MAILTTGFLIYSNSDKNSTNSMTATAASDLAAGAFLVIVVASDNVTTTDGNTNDHTSVTDDAGNVYIKIREFTNGQGGAGSGATVSLWYCLLSNAIVNATTVLTCNFSALVGAKAVTSRFYTQTDRRYGIAIASVADKADDGVDPTVINLIVPSSREYLFIRAQAHERPGTDTYTQSANYTANLKIGTTGGSAATNMTVVFEHRVVTAGSDTTNPAWSNAADEAGIMVAIYETGLHKAKIISQAVNRASFY